MPKKELDVGTDVTKKVTQMYFKVDKLLTLLEKNGEGGAKYQRFKKGCVILSKYFTIVMTEDTGLDKEQFEHDLYGLINKSFSTSESRELVKDLDLFKDLLLFFDYV